MYAKFIYLVIAILTTCSVTAQEENPTLQFWNSLQSHCGKAYQGALELPKEDENFSGKKLVMHLRSCSDTEIKIPFFVGKDKSRTWILSYENNRIALKHDHRHEDGTEDEVNFYGGIISNPGKAGVQVFSADLHTQEVIPDAATNVWWITIDDKSFTYNLRRVDTPRVFKVIMNLTTPIETPDAPWGWNDDN